MPEEGIAEIGDDIKQLAQKAYCNLDPAAQESFALNQLYKIISTEMKVDASTRNVTLLLKQ